MMEPDYGYAGQSIAKDVRPETPLDRIGGYADRVERLTELVARFNNRFFVEPGGAANAAVKPVPSGYFGQIERLGTAIDDLEKTVQRLADIG